MPERPNVNLFINISDALHAHTDRNNSRSGSGSFQMFAFSHGDMINMPERRTNVNLYVNINDVGRAYGSQLAVLSRLFSLNAHTEGNNSSSDHGSLNFFLWRY